MRLSTGKAKETRGITDRFVEVYADKWNTLQEILFRISWIAAKEPFSSPVYVEGIGSAEQTIQAIRACLSGIEDDEKPLTNEFQNEWNQQIKNVFDFMTEQGYEPFSSENSVRKFGKLLVVASFNYLDQNARPNLDRPKYRKVHIQEIYRLFEGLLGAGVSDYVRQIITGKICVEFQIIAPYPESEMYLGGYHDEKDYFRQTVRNALDSLKG